MATLGEDLKRLREERAVSLEEIAGQTKISLRLLKALEDDRHDLLPEPFFIKGVLRAYVKSVGGDEAEFLRRYVEEKAAREPALPESEAKKAKSKPREDGRAETKDLRIRIQEAAPRRVPAERPRRSGRGKRIRVLLALIIVLAAAAVLVVFYIKTRPRPLPRITTTGTESVPAPTMPPVSSASAEIPAGALEAGPLILEFRFLADTWIHVAADGRIVLQGIQPSGGTARCQAENLFVIQTGNAGGFTYTLNGRPGKRLGPSGAVRIDVRIDRDNAGTFLGQGEAPDRAG